MHWLYGHGGILKNKDCYIKVECGRYSLRMGILQSLCKKYLASPNSI